MHIQYIYTSQSSNTTMTIIVKSPGYEHCLSTYHYLYRMKDLYTLNYKHTESSIGVKILCSQMLEILRFQNLLHNTIFYTRTMIKS